MANKAGSLQISLEMQVAALRRDIAAVNTELKRGTDQWQNSISGFASGFKNAFGIAAIGATIAAALGAAQQAVGNLITEMEGISDGAKKIGTTVEEYQKLKIVFEQTGLSAEAMETTIGRMQKTLGQAEAGVKGSLKAFTDLNLNVAALGKVGGVEQLARIADELNDIANPAERAAKGAALFGKAFVQLGPLIAEGGDGIRQLAADAERLSLIFGTDAVNAAESLGDNLDILKKQGMVLLSEFIGPMLEQMNAVTKQTGEASTGVNNFQIVIKLAAVALNLFGKQLAFIVGIFGAMLRGIGIIIGAFADLVRSVTAAGSAVGQVWQAITNPFGPVSITDAVANAETKIGDIMKAALRVMASSIAPAQEILKQIVTPPTPNFSDVTGNTGATGGGGEDAITRQTGKTKALAEAFDMAAASAKLLQDTQRINAKIADDATKALGPELAAYEDLLEAQMAAAGASQYEIDLMRAHGNASLEKIAGINAEIEAINAAAETARTARQQQLALTDQLIEAGFNVGAAFAESSERGKEAMKQLAASIIATIAKAVLLQFVMNAIGGGSGGYGSAIMGALSGVSRSFAGGEPEAAAMGGRSFGGVPLTASGTQSVGSIASGIPFAASMARQKPMKVEVNNYGAQVSTTQDGDTIRILVEAASARIAGDVSSGGNPVAAAIERTYGLRR